MNFLDLAQKRRSCRSYSDRAVSRESLERCLQAARLAPSACNSQPWRFIVVAEESLRQELGRRAFGGLYQMNQFALGAPVLIAVVREASAYAAMIGAVLRGTSYSLLDIGIACEHLVLQAEEEGLGTCWIGWFNERAVKKTLEIPFYKKVEVIISLGYPSERKDQKKNRKELHEISEFR